MNSRVSISTSSENYLEAIYRLSKAGAPVRSVDVSTMLGVSKASVNKAVSVLREAGMVDQELYGSILLTPSGKERAKEVFHRHCMLKTFLTEILGVRTEIAEEDACRMEHVISDETMVRLTGYLQKLLGHHSGCNQEFNSCGCQCQE